MVPEDDLAFVRRWADRRVPAHLRELGRIDVDVSDRAITILECRPPSRDDIGPEWTRLPIARLRFTKTRSEWTLYWCDRRLRYHRYDDVAPTERIEELVAEIERDPAGAFWGLPVAALD